VLLPAGPKIAFTGGLHFNDHRLIWDKLDQVRGKHPDMVLLHGGSPKGGERDLVREVFAVIGAIVIGATAWTRLAASPTAVSAGPGRPALS
jgi:hypothetical protein